MNESESKRAARDRGLLSAHAADAWTAERDGEPRYARRTLRQNAVALFCLMGFALSLLALLVGLADAAGFSLGVSLGLAGPGVATLVFGVAVWTLRSRRSRR